VVAKFGERYQRPFRPQAVTCFARMLQYGPTTALESAARQHWGEVDGQVWAVCVGRRRPIV
jgi:hypothetical protein